MNLSRRKFLGRAGTTAVGAAAIATVGAGKPEQKAPEPYKSLLADDTAWSKMEIYGYTEADSYHEAPGSFAEPLENACARAGVRLSDEERRKLAQFNHSEFAKQQAQFRHDVHALIDPPRG